MAHVANDLSAKLWGATVGLFTMVLAVGCAPEGSLTTTTANCTAPAVVKSSTPAPILGQLSPLLQHLESHLGSLSSADRNDPVKAYTALSQAIDDDARDKGLASDDRQQQLRVMIVLGGDSPSPLTSQPQYAHLVDSVESLPGVRDEVAWARRLISSAKQRLAYGKSHAATAFLMSSSDTVAAVAAATAADQDDGDSTVSASRAVVNANADFAAGMASFSPDSTTTISMDGIEQVGDSARAIMEPAIFADYADGYTPEWSLATGCQSNSGGITPYSGVTATLRACLWCWSTVGGFVHELFTGGIVAWGLHGVSAVKQGLEDAAASAIVNQGLSAANNALKAVASFMEDGWDVPMPMISHTGRSSQK